MTQEQIGKIKEKILARIKSGQVVMRPKWHFVFKTLLALTGAILLFLAALYLISFIVFVTRESGAWFGPGFGARGMIALLRALPWTLILFSLFFIAILEILARRYAFAYRQPLLYSAVGIILLVLIGGAVIAPFHRPLFFAIRAHRAPMLAERFYRGFGPPPLMMVRGGIEGAIGARELYRGTVTGFTEGGFIIEDFEGATTTVWIPQGWPVVLRGDMGGSPKIGANVVVFGAASGTEISARGIKVIRGMADEIYGSLPR